MTKTYQLTIHNRPLTLILPPPQKGCCYKCLLKKEIRVISRPHGDFKRQFCGSCALEGLGELSPQVPPTIIQELRSQLIFGR